MAWRERPSLSAAEARQLHAQALVIDSQQPPVTSGFLFTERMREQLEAWREEGMSRREQDRSVGRDRDTNVEMPDAPSSAHVKRVAQEGFSPEAFVLRRSMPWSDGRGAGLVFVAFGRTLDAFEAQLHRMCGADDGVVDGLFRFTRPVTGLTAWCPPCRDGRLDLDALGGALL